MGRCSIIRAVVWPTAACDFSVGSMASAGKGRGASRVTPQLEGSVERSAQFTGSIPAAYDRFLGPMLFEPYAADLAARLTVPPAAAVLELACGTGILTRHL